MNEKLKKYPKSKNENFYVKDKISVPHPYTITVKHIAFASDNYRGILGEEAIREGEKNNIKCGHKNCKLSFSEHEQALLIACKKDFNSDDEAKKEIKQYLLSIKGICENDGFAGFSFLQEF